MKPGPAPPAFFRGLIDYAGLFPPAMLDLETAFHAYQEYRRGADAWMLGRFVCPEAKLAELLDLVAATKRAATRSGDLPLEISALPAIEWSDPEGVARSFTRLADVRIRSHQRAAVTAVEVKVPEGVPLDAVLSRIPEASRILPSAPVFLEPATTIEGIESLALALSHRSIGLKLRCGGVAPFAFPEPGIVARALVLCRDHAIPFKATAGLHHPLRHHRAEPELTTWMHGFVNVFAAAILAHALGMDEVTIREVVEEQDPASFRFDGDALSWRAHHVSGDQVRALRAGFVTSFGSCSFDEPRADLRALGWLR